MRQYLAFGASSRRDTFQIADNSMGMFSGKLVPAVGVSLGIERIFSPLEQKHRSLAEASNGRIRETKAQVQYHHDSVTVPVRNDVTALCDQLPGLPT